VIDHPRGEQTMSGVHVEPGGERVWMVHSAVADITATPMVTTAHLGVYVPAPLGFFEVLDTTGVVDKQIVFPGNGRVLYVGQRAAGRDVFALIDAVARKPLAQRTHPGDRTDFRISPSGRVLLSVDKTDHTVRLLDTGTLSEQVVPAQHIPSLVWAPGEDVLYGVRLGTDTGQLLRYDLRTADLGAPLPPPVPVVTLPATAGGICMSPDGRHAAIAFTARDPSGIARNKVALVDLATGGFVSADGGVLPSDFTNDNRAIVWHVAPREFVLVDPTTGASSAPVAVDLMLPTLRPLRHHDLLLIGPVADPTGMLPPPFLYRISDGARIPVRGLRPGNLAFEHPDRSEAWTLGPVVMRLDLATGKLDTIASGADGADVRVASDEIVIGVAHTVRRLSMATGQYTGSPFELPDPNDVAAPARLTAD
jgi:hypothetical protein